MHVTAIRPALILTLVYAGLTPAMFAQAPQFEPAKAVKIKPEDRARFEKALTELDKGFKNPHTPALARGQELPKGWADAEIGRKALRWILKYNEFYTPKFVGMTDKAIELTKQRLKSLETQAELKPGFGTVLGYISSVDGSVQPYALYLPPDANEIKPTRLLVVLHGRNQNLNEVSFIDAHQGKPYPKNELENGMKRAVLHVYGRTNNGYRWAGETDVLEAINDCISPFSVHKRISLAYPLDVDLQGFSMGGAGAWHLGLHYSERFRTVEAGAGFNETVKYARLKNMPSWVEKTLHIYDSYEVARNINAVPTIGYGGEDDPQLAASKNIVGQLQKEGFHIKTDSLLSSTDEIPFLQVVGAKMGHKVDAASRKIMDDFVKKQQSRPIRPAKIDYVTYTLKYPKSGWFILEKLDEHYRKAWVQAEENGDRSVLTITRLDNIASFMVLGGPYKKVVLLNQIFEIDGRFLKFVRNGDQWSYVPISGDKLQFGQESKHAQHQGPIDDAFTSGFVVVGPEDSGNSVEQKLMEEFRANWSKFLRGDLPVGTVPEVKMNSQGQYSGSHLVLFGTPKNNRLMAEVMPKLKQIKWSETEFTLGGKTYSTSDHIPVLIAPNPLNTRKYVVINSGHTFGKTDFEGTNALLYPRMGDWGVLKVKADGSTEIVDSGFFDEQWNPK